MQIKKSIELEKIKILNTVWDTYVICVYETNLHSLIPH